AAPDQAAAATAIATGTRVPNGAIAINVDKKPLQSIIELAREYGRATGLVTDTKLTDPTSVAFYAHPVDPNDIEKIAAELVDGGKIDIAMGGGASQFLPATKGGERQDNRERTLAQTVELDRAVALARRYAGEKSTIIVCGDVAIGGMNLNGFPFRQDSGIALLGRNSTGQPWITWATGPHGMSSYGAAN